MELGATVCLPKQPQCSACPVSIDCAARASGREGELPVRARKPEFATTPITLLIVERAARLLLRRRPEGSRRMAGFWELPESSALPAAEILKEIAVFRHTIVRTKYVCRVAVADPGRRQAPSGFEWVPICELNTVALSTTARKALACYSARFRCRI